jgi:hypothetical protein
MRGSRPPSLKPGYCWRKGDQVPTKHVTIIEIMSDPEFQQGVDDVRAGRDFPADYDAWKGRKGHHSWSYERGRQWAMIAPRSVVLKVNGRVTQRAQRWYTKDIL